MSKAVHGQAGSATDPSQGSGPSFDGDHEAIAQILDAYRPYLLLIAERELDSQLRIKVGASDLVQQTVIKAFQGYGDFHGSDEAALKGWLHRILRNCLADELKKYRYEKRSVVREVPLDNDSKGWVREHLPAEEPSPSQKLMSQEELTALTDALGRLPELYRQVISLRNGERLEFAEVGKRLNRSGEAARLLWYRALRRLEREMIQT